MSFIRRDNERNDGIKVDSEHAKRLQWDLLHSWKPWTDVAFLTYGPGLLTLVTAYSGHCFSVFYRRKLRLQNLSHFSIYVPTVLLPGALSPLFHRLFVSSNIIIDPQCIVCDQVKASMFQIGLGIVQPFFLSPIASYMVANRYATVRLPPMYPDWRGMLKYHFNLSKPFYSQTLPLLFGLNTLVAMFVTYLEYKNIASFAEKMRKLEDLGDRLSLSEVQ